MTYLDEITRQLSRDEGRRATGYKDSRGIWTIGVGHNVESGPPIPESAIDLIFESDLSYVEKAITSSLPWVIELDPVRHGVLINMAFNLGMGGLLGFNNMLTAIQAGDWDEAAHQLMSSRYATQVGFRANRLALQLITGEWK